MSETNIHALPIGHTFDGYRILRLLGAGGFGITYLAEEVQIGRKVAIKEYLPQGYAARAADSFTVRAVSTSAQPQFAWGLDRFRKEAATLVAFEHPNIVSVYRYFEANGTAYLVMQYVEGKPLDALLAGGKTLAESEIEEVIHPILGGLEQVHAAHFLHRDVKPANIYIRKDGRPVLLDFGAARQAFGSETKSITAIVSEGYAPFEQYEAKGDQGPWTDVYALGAVIYRCVTGERPPAAPERVSARLRGAADPMVPAREAGAGRYSARMLDAADQALSVMQAERPQSIAALRALLKGGATSHVASISVHDAPVRRPAHVGGATINAGRAPAKRKSRVPLLAGGVGAVAAAAIAAYVLLAPKPPPDSAVSPGTPPVRASAPPAPAESAEEAAAERAAQEAATKAETELAALSAAMQRGELVRAKAELPGLRTRIEEALRKRPAHVGLRRVDAAARAAETDLAQRVAARVKELAEAAERDAADGDKADRIIAEIEQLDPAAAKTVRDRVQQIRRAAQERSRDGDRAREEAEKRRAEEQKRLEEERRARQAQIELHASLARYHLEQAVSASREKRYAEARRTLEQVGVQLKRAADLIKGGAEPATVAAARRDLAAFERDLAKKIADHVAGLVIEARRLTGAGKFDDALRLLDEAAEIEPASSAVADARKAAEAARQQAADEARRRTEAETRKRNEAEALARIARQRLDQAKAALQAKRFAEARRLADDAAGAARDAARAASDLPPVAAVQGEIEAFQRDLVRQIGARVAELVESARAHIKAGRFDEADRSLDEAEALEPASDAVVTARREYEAARKQAADDRRRVEEDARRRTDAETRKRNEAEALARIARQRLDRAKAALQGKRYLEARRLADDAAGTAREAARVSSDVPQVVAAQRDIESFQRDLARSIAARVAELIEEARAHIKAGRFDDAGRRIDEAEALEPASDAVVTARREYEAARKQAAEDRRRAEEEARRRAEAETRKRNEAEALARIARQRLDQAKAALQGKRYLEARRLADDAAGTVREAARVSSDAPQVVAAQRDIESFQRDLARSIAARVAELIEEARAHIKAGRLDEAGRSLDDAEALEPASNAVVTVRREYEAARKQAAEDRQRAEEEARRRAEAETRKRNEAEALARIARQRLDQAKAALQGKRYLEARRLADDAAGTARQAARVSSDVPQVVAAQRDIESFQRDLARSIAARVAELAQAARAHIKAGRYDDADRSLDEAEGLDSSSETVRAARREYAAARKDAEDRRRTEDEARRQREAEEERRKREEAARPPDPDAAERERTRRVVRRPIYDVRTRRGAAYFAFGEQALAGPALAVLQRGADAARADANARLLLVCGYDQLEVKDSAEGLKLARGRCEAAQQEAARRGVASASVRIGVAAPGKGPDYRRVAFAVQSDKPPETAKVPEQTERPGAYQLAGRTGSLSRISPERRAVMRIHLQFGSGGTMGVSCVAELADGGQSACFGQANGTGNWSLTGTTLCLASAVINIAARTCYQVSGSGNQIVLAGPGILAGAMFLR